MGLHGLAGRWLGRGRDIIILATIRAYDLEVLCCQICEEGSKGGVAVRAQKIGVIDAHTSILGELDP